MRIAIARGLLFGAILLLPLAATAQFAEKKVLTLEIAREIVTAADMRRADENLRVGAAAVGALDHRFANVPFSGDVDLMKAYAFARKQVLGVLAIRAVLHGIDVDGGHDRT